MLQEQSNVVGSLGYFDRLPLEIRQSIFASSALLEKLTLERVHSFFAGCYETLLPSLFKRVYTTYQKYLPPTVPYTIPTYTDLKVTFGERLLSPKELYLIHAGLSDTDIKLLSERLTKNQFQAFLCTATLTLQEILTHQGSLTTATIANNFFLLKSLINTQGLNTWAVIAQDTAQGILGAPNETQRILNAAASLGRLRIIKYLVEKQSECPVKSTLNAASRSGCLDTIRYLNKKYSGFPITPLENIMELRGIERTTILASAVASGDTSCVQHIIESYKDNTAFRNKFSLHVEYINQAFINGHSEIAHYLVEFMGVLNSEEKCNMYGKDFLWLAMASGDLASVQYLLDLKSVPLHKEWIDQYILQFLVYSGSRALAEYLIGTKQVNIPFNMLSKVVEAGHIELSQYLIEAENQLLTKDILMIAARRGHITLLRYFLEKWTSHEPGLLEEVFQLAHSHSHVNIIMFLLEDARLKVSEKSLKSILPMLVAHAEGDTLIWLLEKMTTLNINIQQKYLLSALFSNYSLTLKEDLYQVEEKGLAVTQEVALTEFFVTSRALSLLYTTHHSDSLSQYIPSKNPSVQWWMYDRYLRTHVPAQRIGYKIKPLHLQSDLRHFVIKHYLQPTSEAMTQLARAGLLDDCRALLEKVETPKEKVIFAKIIHDNFPYRLSCSAQEQWLNSVTSVDHRVDTRLHG